jgi:hypothetical protein
MLNQNVKETALEQFEANLRCFDIVETDQYFQIDMTAKNYSTEMIHTATFAWTKDLESTDFDLIFSVKAEALLAAGVHPDEVERWDYLQNDDGMWVFQKAFTLQDATDNQTTEHAEKVDSVGDQPDSVENIPAQLK